MPRYGRLLAEAAADNPAVEVVEVDAGDRSASLGDLRRAARAAERRGRDRASSGSSPIGAAAGARSRGSSRSWPPRAASRSLPRSTTSTRVADGATDGRGRQPWALRLLGRRAAGSSSMRTRSGGASRGWCPGQAVTVVPHFVEQRGALAGCRSRPSASWARRSAGRDVARLHHRAQGPPAAARGAAAARRTMSRC